MAPLALVPRGEGMGVRGTINQRLRLQNIDKKVGFEHPFERHSLMPLTPHPGVPGRGEPLSLRSFESPTLA